MPEKTTPCKACGKIITFTVPDGAAGAFLRGLSPAYCDVCGPAADALEHAASVEAEREEIRKARADFWEKNVPPLYRDTEPGKLPVEAVPAITRCATWRYGATGIGLAGESRRGKTRTIFLLLERLLITEGKRFVYLSAADFSHKVSRLSSGPMEEFDKLISRLCQTPILFLDDLGKGKLTERVEAELYHVVETRTRECLPIFWTCNATGDVLLASMSADRGPAIVERLREFCDVVTI